MEVLVELSTAATHPQCAWERRGAAAAAAAAAGGAQQPQQQPQQQQCGVQEDVRWVPRAVAHFVMVLAKSSQPPPEGGLQQQRQQQQQQRRQQQQQQQQREGPAWGVPAVLPTTALEQQHFDTGE
jgi:hypothetical protein